MTRKTAETKKSGNTGTNAVDETVAEVHQRHVKSHPYVEDYVSAGDYFQNKLGLGEVGDRYYDLPPYAALRIHSYAPRPVLLLQKNPNLIPRWVQDDVHWAYPPLAGDIAESTLANMVQEAKGLTKYLNDSRRGRTRLKFILDAVREEMGHGYDGNIHRQSEFEEYLQLADAEAFLSDRSHERPYLDAGFHGDFVYTNLSKWQARGSSADIRPEDEDWLHDEIAAINPRVVIALGNDAYYGLLNIGFEKTGDYSEYSDNNTGHVLRYEGDNSRLDGTRAVNFRHLEYMSGAMTVDKDAHEALRLAMDSA